MSNRSNEQRLVDTCFEVAMRIHAEHAMDIPPRSREELGRYVAEALRDAGFDTKPCGMCWGVLVDEQGEFKQ